MIYRDKDGAARTDCELRTIALGTMALLYILSAYRPNSVKARVGALLRAMLHDKPHSGRYVKNGRAKLAINFRRIKRNRI